MPQRPKIAIQEDGIDFAKNNSPYAKEKEPDPTMKVIDKNFDYNAIKRFNK
jgi:hypothetical protein